jgi:hypothetical protein
MSNIEFTTRGGIPTTCDSCGRPTTVGLWHLHRGTPVLFDCVPCAERLVGTQAVAAAIEAHKEVAHLRMELAAG